MEIGFPASTSPDEHSHIARRSGELESKDPRARHDQGHLGTRQLPEKWRRDGGSGPDHLQASSGRFPGSRRNSRETVATQIERQLSGPPHRSPGSLQVKLPYQFHLPESPQFDISSFGSRQEITKSSLQRNGPVAGYLVKKSNVEQPLLVCRLLLEKKEDV